VAGQTTANSESSQFIMFLVELEIACNQTRMELKLIS